MGSRVRRLLHEIFKTHRGGRPPGPVPALLRHKQGMTQPTASRTRNNLQFVRISMINFFLINGLNGGRDPPAMFRNAWPHRSSNACFWL